MKKALIMIAHFTLLCLCVIAMFQVMERCCGVVLAELPRIISAPVSLAVIFSVFIIAKLTETTHPVTGIFFAVIVSPLILGLLVILTLVVGNTIGVIIIAILVALELVFLLWRIMTG